MGIFDWFKWSKLLISAEDKFADIYNFDVPLEYKNEKQITPLAFCVLFEEMRINKVLPDDIQKIIRALRKNSPFYRFITPVGSKLIDWNAYKTIYTHYVDYRAKRERPFVSMLLAINFEENITLNDIIEIREDYNSNPYFGNNV